MPGGANPAPPPRVRTFSFRSAVLEANKRLPKNYPVYLWSKGKQRKDSGPESGIYALREYAGTLYDDLTAYQSTLSQQTIDGFTKALKITPSAADGQAQLIVDTVKGTRYRLEFQYYSNSVDEAGRIVIYNGDTRGTDPAQSIIPSPWFDAVSVWTKAEATFVAESEISTIGMEANYPNVAWIRSMAISVISGTSTVGVLIRTFFDGTIRTLPDGSNREIRTERP